MTKKGLNLDIHQELSRVARLGANIVDAHSCFIFLPSIITDSLAKVLRLGAPTLELAYQTDLLELLGWHSLSNDIVPACSLRFDHGLIGWVAKHARAIHVSPFEHDSRTLGVYIHDQMLKSFMGVPIEVAVPQAPEIKAYGVLACDSKKAFAFSKLQGKLLEELSQEISTLVNCMLLKTSQPSEQSSWDSFLQRAQQLTEALTENSIEVLRLQLHNFSELESEFGTARVMEIVAQIERLIQQALPPHFPLFRSINGDFILVLDNMMTSFYESKISAVCKHLNLKNLNLAFSFNKAAWRDKAYRGFSLEQLIASTTTFSNLDSRIKAYEHRRA